QQRACLRDRQPGQPRRLCQYSCLPLARDAPRRMACRDQRLHRTGVALLKAALPNRLQRDPAEKSLVSIAARAFAVREASAGQIYWSLTTLLCPIASRAIVPCPQVIVLPLQHERACFDKSGWRAVGHPLS